MPQAAVVAAARKGLLAPFRPQRRSRNGKKLSRFARSFFLVSPIYGFAEGVTFLLDVMPSKEAMPLYFFVSDFFNPPAEMIF